MNHTRGFPVFHSNVDMQSTVSLLFEAFEFPRYMGALEHQSVYTSHSLELRLWTVASHER